MLEQLEIGSRLFFTKAEINEATYLPWVVIHYHKNLATG